MPNQQIQSITELLPYSLREAVNGYVQAVAAVVPDIARDARVEIHGERTDQFLLMVAIRKIWASINSQFWIMNDCVSAATRLHPGQEGEPQTRGFRIGRDEISRNSRASIEAADLRQEFQRLIDRLDIEEFVLESNSLSDLAARMFAR